MPKFSFSDIKTKISCRIEKQLSSCDPQYVNVMRDVSGTFLTDDCRRGDVVSEENDYVRNLVFLLCTCTLADISCCCCYFGKISSDVLPEGQIWIQSLHVLLRKINIKEALYLIQWCTKLTLSLSETISIIRVVLLVFLFNEIKPLR